MDRITVTVSASDPDEVADILFLIAGQVRDGYTSGADRNDTSRYSYAIIADGFTVGSAGRLTDEGIRWDIGSMNTYLPSKP